MPWRCGVGKKEWKGRRAGQGTGRRREAAEVRPCSLQTSAVRAASCWHSHTRHHCSGSFPRPRMLREGRLHWVQPVPSPADRPQGPLCPQQPPWLLLLRHVGQDPPWALQVWAGDTWAGPLCEATGWATSQLRVESSGLSLFFTRHQEPTVTCVIETLSFFPFLQGQNV